MSRAFYNKAFKSSVMISVVICCFLLVFLFGVIIWKGLSAISFSFLFQPAENFGAEGGILYQILGSLLMVLTAAVISFPIALGTAIYKSEYIDSVRGQKICAIMIYGLNGIPSIIFGIFGLIFFVNFLGTGISWFVGAIILALMILPAITMSAYHAINSIPTIYRESAQALGLTKWQVIVSVLIPQGINGAVTGLMVGLARAIGETAPIMFVATAFSGVQLPSSLFDPVSTLPTHILALAQQATDPVALKNAWGSSLVLIAIVLMLSVSALWLRVKTHTTR